MDLYIKDMLDANTTTITTMVDSLVIDSELPCDGLSFQSRRHHKVKRTFTISKDENGRKSVRLTHLSITQMNVMVQIGYTTHFYHYLLMMFVQMRKLYVILLTNKIAKLEVLVLPH